MPVQTRSFPRRGASSAMPIFLIVIGAAMLVVGIVIGKSMDKSDQTPNAANDTNGTTATNVARNVPNFNAGDDIDPATEAKMDAARLAAQRHEDDVEDQDDQIVDLGGTPPPIVFEPNVLDFGIVPPGRHITGTVLIRNTGTEPLFIEASRASCTCTAVDMANTWIQPGQSVPMDATFTQATLGDKQASVRVKFKDYDAIAQLPIKALVALAVMAEPPYIQASQSRDAATTVFNGQLTIRSLDERPFRILAIDGRPPSYVDFNPAVDAPRNTYEVTWDISDINEARCVDRQGRPLHRFWVVETDHPECPAFDIQVRHKCTLPEPRGRRNWLVSPPRMLLGELKPGESMEVEGSIKWIPKAPHDEKVHAIMSESPYLDIELLKFIPGNSEDRFIIRITAKDNAPEGLLYETARVHSQNNKAPLLLTGRFGKK